MAKFIEFRPRENQPADWPVWDVERVVRNDEFGANIGHVRLHQKSGDLFVYVPQVPKGAIGLALSPDTMADIAAFCRDRTREAKGVTT